MKSSFLSRIVLVLVAALTFSSCSSDSPTNTTPTQSMTINGTTVSGVVVVGASNGGYYQIMATDPAGGRSIGITFPSRPTSNGTYTPILNAPTGMKCVVSLTESTKAYLATGGGSIQVTVSGSTVRASFSNITVTNGAMSSDTKVISLDVSTTM